MDEKAKRKAFDELMDRDLAEQGYNRSQRRELIRRARRRKFSPAEKAKLRKLADRAVAETMEKFDAPS